MFAQLRTGIRLAIHIRKSPAIHIRKTTAIHIRKSPAIHIPRALVLATYIRKWL